MIFTNLNPDFSGLEASKFCFSQSKFSVNIITFVGLEGYSKRTGGKYWQASERILNVTNIFLQYILGVLNFFQKINPCDMMEWKQAK